MLLSLYEQDGRRMGELTRRTHLSKQTMTELARRRLGPREVAELKATLAELIDLGQSSGALPAALWPAKAGAETARHPLTC